MTGQDDTTAIAGSAEDTQAQGARPWHARFASLRVPQTAPTSLAGVVDAYFDVAQGLLEAQRELVKDLASSLRVGREPAPAAGADTRQAAERERAEQQRAEQERAEQERGEQAERERAERYRGQSRVQLVEGLRQRGLPRTGSKAELVERLLEADDR